MQDVRTKQIITFIMPSKIMRCAVALECRCCFHFTLISWRATFSDFVYLCVCVFSLGRHDTNKKSKFFFFIFSFSQYNSKLIISGTLKIGIIITNLLAPKQRNENDSNRLKNMRSAKIISMALFTYTWCEAVVTRLHDFVLNIFLVVFFFFRLLLLLLSKVVVSDAA